MRRDPLADVFGLPHTPTTAVMDSAEHRSEGEVVTGGVEQFAQPLLRRTLAPQCRLIIMRHAKSSWRDPLLDDHDRPLNKRGRRDAPRVAAELQRRGWAPKAVIMSDSVRTTETWARMAAALAQPPGADAVLSDPHLYHGHAHSGAGAVQQALLRAEISASTCSEGSCQPTSRHQETLADKLNLRSNASPSSSSDRRAMPLPRPGPVLVLGHNPGLEEAVVLLTGRAGPDRIELKTATAVLLEVSAESWKEAFDTEINDPTWALRGVIHPKELSDDMVPPPPQLFSMRAVPKPNAPKVSREDFWLL